MNEYNEEYTELLIRFAKEKKAFAPTGLADEVAKRGNHLVFRQIRNPEEAKEVLDNIGKGTPHLGFRNTTSVDGHAVSTKQPKITAAIKKGKVPIFTSPYPTVANSYTGGANLLLAIEHSPDGLIYKSTRAGQTNSVAYSAVFPDSEHVIDANSIKKVHVISPEHKALLDQHYTHFSKGYSSGQYRNAFKDKDPALMEENLKESMNLRPVKEKLTRPFIDDPMVLDSGLSVSRGQKVRLHNGTVGEIHKHGMDTPYFYLNAVKNIPIPTEKEIEEKLESFKQYDHLKTETPEHLRELAVRSLATKHSNIKQEDIQSVWDKASRKWL